MTIQSPREVFVDLIFDYLQSMTTLNRLQRVFKMKVMLEFLCENFYRIVSPPYYKTMYEMAKKKMDEIKEITGEDLTSDLKLISY